VVTICRWCEGFVEMRPRPDGLARSEPNRHRPVGTTASRTRSVRAAPNRSCPVGRPFGDVEGTFEEIVAAGADFPIRDPLGNPIRIGRSNR
jgi:hypothetical protein